jgi:hypothetical protein
VSDVVNYGRFVPDLGLWKPWMPPEVAERLAAVDEPWFITAGWAIDLFVGRRTRDHGDTEVAVGRRSFDAVRRALPDCELFVVGDGLARPATRDALAAHHQTWVREPDTGTWRLDLLREPWDGDTWVFRRDPRIRLPLARAFERTDEGVPYARPEIVLLFKAKEAREKDEADLAAALPLLEDPKRRWLADALSLAHPGHRWLEALEG